jgi:NTP pyrophosphatase (non-canonical NTP hydrolase)
MTKLNAKKLSELHENILKFNSQRGWNPSAQNIAKSVVIEAAELLEHFQWDNTDEDLKKKDLTEVGFEMADVIWYLFLLADKLNIDLAEAIAHKYKHNEKKYPAGHYNDEFYYAQKKKYREEKKNVKK